VILLAEPAKSSLAAQKMRRESVPGKATPTPKNRVWDFIATPPGRPDENVDLSWESATGSVRFTYENVSGRGVFISRDPLSGAEFSQGTNLYAYCRNNFLNMSDATGMCFSLTGDPNSFDPTSALLGAGLLPDLSASFVAAVASFSLGTATINPTPETNSEPIPGMTQEEARSTTGEQEPGAEPATDTPAQGPPPPTPTEAPPEADSEGGALAAKIEGVILEELGEAAEEGE
jgi:hypothetical protein